MANPLTPVKFEPSPTKEVAVTTPVELMSPTSNDVAVTTPTRFNPPVSVSSVEAEIDPVTLRLPEIV